MLSGSETLVVPRNKGQYDQLVSWLDNLIDEVGEDEAHPLASLMDVLGVLIERFETEFVPELQTYTFIHSHMLYREVLNERKLLEAKVAR